MFSTRTPPPSVDRTALVTHDEEAVKPDAKECDTVSKEECDAMAKEVDTARAPSGCKRSGCKHGKCCPVAMAIGAPIAIVTTVALSPIIIPTLLVRRALYGPMKCKCNRKCSGRAEGEAEAKGTEKQATVEIDVPKTDRM
jgi:hypothetical protein